MSATDAPPRKAPRWSPTGADDACFATNLYHDRAHGIDAAKILPGEYFVTDKDMMIVTVLGSCVCACIRDPDLALGGMNHFMLPDRDREAEAGGELSTAARYGRYAMELLIDHLLQLGARRDRLEAKVFGGGSVLPGITNMSVGRRNADFVLNFLKAEHIRVRARDLADIFPRRVHFFPATGRVLVKRLTALKNDTILKREAEYRARLEESRGGGAHELFT
jgi:chemotaxis protein CheD